jgi:hypothetical protein
LFYSSVNVLWGLWYRYIEFSFIVAIFGFITIGEIFSVFATCFQSPGWQNFVLKKAHKFKELEISDEVLNIKTSMRLLSKNLLESSDARKRFLANFLLIWNITQTRLVMTSFRDYAWCLWVIIKLWMLLKHSWFSETFWHIHK